jgi:hypothetical protein
MKWGDKNGWSKEVKKEIRRVIKNFNSKIDRVTKKNPTIAEYQPEKLTFDTLAEKINSKKDFNRELNSLKRYSNKGVENVKTYASGLSTTDWEVKETKNKVRFLNLKNNAKVQKLGVDVTKGNMGTLENANLKERKFSTNKTQNEWDKFIKSLDKQLNSIYDKENLELYKANYLKALENKLNLSTNDKLYKKVNSMSAKCIYEFSVGNPYVCIDFVYDDNLDSGDRLDSLYDEWGVE